MCTGQSDGGNTSIQVPSSQVQGKLTKTHTTNRNLPHMSHVTSNLFPGDLLAPFTTECHILTWGWATEERERERDRWWGWGICYPASRVVTCKPSCCPFTLNLAVVPSLRSLISHKCVSKLHTLSLQPTLCPSTTQGRVFRDWSPEFGMGNQACGDRGGCHFRTGGWGEAPFGSGFCNKT